jgi:hypothetical protein
MCMKFNADFDLQQPGAPIMTFFVEHKGSSKQCLRRCARGPIPELLGETWPNRSQS